MAKATEKTFTAFTVNTYKSDGGYQHTKITIWETSRVDDMRAIGDMIRSCDIPGHYRDATVSADQKRRFQAMQSDGVTGVFSSTWTTRLDIEWQHFEQNEAGEWRYCDAHFGIADGAREVHASYKLLQKMERATARAAKRDYAYWDKPDHAIAALRRMGAVELEWYREGGYMGEWVTKKPLIKMLRTG